MSPRLAAVLVSLSFAWTRPPAAAATAAENRRAARELIASGDFEGAYDRIVSLLAEAPYDRETLALRLGVERSAGSRLLRWAALADAERRAREPGLPDARRAEVLVESARVRLQVGDAAGAEESCLRALELKPGDAGASSCLAEALRDRPERALPHAERSAAAAPTPRAKAAAHRLSGEIRTDLGDLDGARRDFERALAVDGDDLEALRGLARALIGRPKEARAAAARASRVAQAAPLWFRGAALRFSAHLWLELKEHREAAADLERALSLDPDDLDALETMVRVKNARPPGSADVGGPAARSAAIEPPVLASAEAAERFEAELADTPGWRLPDAYRLLARTYAALGDKRKAYRSVRRAEAEEIGSVRTARILVEIAPGSEDSARDLQEAVLTVSQTRAELGTR